MWPDDRVFHWISCVGRVSATARYPVLSVGIQDAISILEKHKSEMAFRPARTVSDTFSPQRSGTDWPETNLGRIK